MGLMIPMGLIEKTCFSKIKFIGPISPILICSHLLSITTHLKPRSDAAMVGIFFILVLVRKRDGTSYLNEPPRTTFEVPFSGPSGLSAFLNL